MNVLGVLRRGYQLAFQHRLQGWAERGALLRSCLLGFMCFCMASKGGSLGLSS